MSKKCIICKKILTEKEYLLDCYHYYDIIVHQYHKGVEEWYEKICEKDDLEYLSAPAIDIIRKNRNAIKCEKK